MPSIAVESDVKKEKEGRVDDNYDVLRAGSKELRLT